MDRFREQLILRTATIDELLSDDFDALPGEKSQSDTAAKRLAAWCQTSASGDWALFERRLKRDGLSIAQSLAKFAGARRKASRPCPAWVEDALWIATALESEAADLGVIGEADRAWQLPFAHLLVPIVARAYAMLRDAAGPQLFGRLEPPARDDLSLALLERLSALASAALYERFAKARDAAQPGDMQQPTGNHASQYDAFVAGMKDGGLRQLFEAKPVLLRLMAVVTRQWIETSRELLMRLDADSVSIRRDLLGTNADARIARIEGGLADPHNHGRSVQLIVFADGAKVVYKPKDLRLDAAWHALVERLNAGGAPIELKAARVLVREGYGWSEFVAHEPCRDVQGCERFFRRAGAWLALFHAFAATDMHQENIIAAGDHPVPVDLEMILQPTAEEYKAASGSAEAFEAATDLVLDSVMTVGLLPSYGKSPGGDIYAIGGVTSDWTTKTQLAWTDVNTDKMRPAKHKKAGKTIPNLPHVGGRYARLGDHLEDFIRGFEDYARFLSRLGRSANQGGLFEEFAGLPARRVLRPTRFYAILLQRLQDHRNMEDGVLWSAHADFTARFADWEMDEDPIWPLLRAERAALIELNVPHFVSPSDEDAIRDVGGAKVSIGAIPGLERARSRLRRLDQAEIAWQVQIIRQNTGMVSTSAGNDAAGEQRRPLSAAAASPSRELFLGEADRIAAELSQRAIRKGEGAAWIGLDWLGDSEVSQLVALGPQLYNGVSGIALFLAAHAAVVQSDSSEDLARAALSHLRDSLKRRDAMRLARALGIGAATGLGSVVYALTVIATLLGDDDMLADAHVAAGLITDDLIAADRQLDVMGGSAGAVLALLRLYRASGSPEALERAARCGRHLLAQSRSGEAGCRSWKVPGAHLRPLNGMAHGAAGFAYSLAALARATGREDFAEAAAECIACENASYDGERNNWPDLRTPEPSWPCQWCRGAPGIGLARIATARCGSLRGDGLGTDIENALAGAENGWPRHVDTLCCGTLGSIEFFHEAGDALGRTDLTSLACRRLAQVIASAAANGDYRWNTGRSDFNVGFFRGLAGAGYTTLRRVDTSLPNVLIWE